MPSSSRKLLNTFTKHYQLDFKNNTFDFLRLILALGIVYYHARGFIVTNSPWQFIEYKGASDYFLHYVDISRLAVYGFLIISGFLITSSLEHSKNLQDFFTKGILRIYPVYIVCLFVMVLLFFLLVHITQGARPIKNYFTNFWPESLRYVMSNFFDPAVYDILPRPIIKVHGFNLEINGPLWTLFFEIRGYILIAILSLLGCLKQNWKLLIPLGICWVL